MIPENIREQTEAAISLLEVGSVFLSLRDEDNIAEFSVQKIQQLT